ncbi:uncharacterized protein LOC107652354 [Monodelphis domestica]|uniref:uncharacterized protein LOC107652354 n=1 Tax=Monodelphis domestica TaxID=13616 RepID=UPI0024E1DB10|nr:uncharacterized protein LOC107652354 [Monodelphis domestica]XP_056649561.1 uncharacterized protein LOC107652354 [Monodelphis domestica]
MDPEKFGETLAYLKKIKEDIITDKGDWQQMIERRRKLNNTLGSLRMKLDSLRNRMDKLDKKIEDSKNIFKEPKSSNDIVYQQAKNESEEYWRRILKEDKGKKSLALEDETMYENVAEQRIPDNESGVKEHDQNLTDSAHQKTKSGPGEDQRDLKLLQVNKGRLQYGEKSSAPEDETMYENVAEQRIPDNESGVKEHDQNLTDSVQQKTKSEPRESQRDLKLLEENKGRFQYGEKFSVSENETMYENVAEQRIPDNESGVKEYDQNLTDSAHQKTKSVPGEDQRDLNLLQGNKGRFKYSRKSSRSEDETMYENVAKQRLPDNERGVKDYDQNLTDSAHQKTKSVPGEDQRDLNLLQGNKGRFKYRKKSSRSEDETMYENVAKQRLPDNERGVKDYDQSLTDSVQQKTKSGPGEDQRDLKLLQANKGRFKYSRKSSRSEDETMYENVAKQRLPDNERGVKDYDQNLTDSAHQKTKSVPGEDQRDLNLLQGNKGRFKYRKKSSRSEDETMYENVAKQRLPDNERGVKDYDQSLTDSVQQKTKSGPGEDQRDLNLLQGNKGRFKYRKKSSRSEDETMYENVAKQRLPDNERGVKDYDQSLTDSVQQKTKSGPGEDQRDLKLLQANKGRFKYSRKSSRSEDETMYENVAKQRLPDNERGVKDYDQSLTDSVQQKTKSGPGEDQRDLKLLQANKGRFKYSRKSSRSEDETMYENVAKQRLPDNERGVKDYDQSLTDSVQQKTKSGPGEDQRDLKLLQANKGRFKYSRKSSRSEDETMYENVAKQRLPDNERGVKDYDQSLTDSVQQKTKSGPGEDQRDLNLLQGNKGRFKYRKKSSRSEDETMYENVAKQRLPDNEREVKEHDQSLTDSVQQKTKSGPGEDQRDLKLLQGNKGRFKYGEKSSASEEETMYENVAEQRISDNESGVKEHDQNLIDLKKRKPSNKNLGQTFVLNGRRLNLR